jgi:tetratricopeptide (TPR) repeat protein
LDHFKDGVALGREGKTNEAMQEYIASLNVNPGFVKSRLNLGALLYDQGKFSAAEREFRLVLSQVPDHVVAHENLALTLEAKGGQDEEAYQQWRIALINERRPEWQEKGKASIARLETKLRVAAELETATPASDVDVVPPKFAARPHPDDLAIIIGIEKYQKLIPARYARADAERVVTYLRALGYAPRNIELLLNEAATQSGIHQAIETWLVERARADSRVLVYYSGHGSQDLQSGEAFLVPYDGDPSYLKQTAYSLKTLYGKLGDLAVKEVMVTLDSCFSGQGGRSVLAPGVRPAVVSIEDPVLASPRLAVLTAAQGTQISTSSNQTRHGVFTYYFLKALQEGRQDLGAIYEYVTSRVEDEAKLQNVRQIPTLKPGLEQVRGRFMLYERP